MKTYPDIGILIPEIYLPKPSVDLYKWAVIAVDQFTSQPDYWEQVEKIVGDAPSTFRIILPEIHLEKPDEAERIQSIQTTMRQYLDAGILQPREGLIYIERTVGGKTRKGLMLCLDLECYDYTSDSTSLIRATEGIIIDRLPPRMKIRDGAALELPHTLVLIDDPQCTVIEPISASKANLEKLYDFDLMLGSGHLTGYAVNDATLENAVVSALRGLAQPEIFANRYSTSADQPVLLFAVGDGNHSLATAKAIWDKIKITIGLDHPARYALVEIENVHDDGLAFEPIHRVLFGLKQDFFAALRETFGANLTYTAVASAEEMINWVDANHNHAAHDSQQLLLSLTPGPSPENEKQFSGEGRSCLPLSRNHLFDFRRGGLGVRLNSNRQQAIGLVDGGGGKTFGVIEIANPVSTLPVVTIQAFIDSFLKAGGTERIDYVHGQDVIVRLGSQPGNVGIYLPSLEKSDLFKTVILNGILPRKTFSMGEAREKRFYLEARRIA